MVMKHNTFKDWVLSGCPGLRGDQSSYINEHVNIYKLENITHYWNTILKKCGVPLYHRLHLKLKHDNKSDHLEYRKYYDTLELKLAAKSILRDDIKYLGYEYI
jgi:hypothetical protein